MIRILSLAFLGMFFYGLVVGTLAGAMLSLGMFAFVLYADRRFAAQDKAYAADPRNAMPAQCPTSNALAEHDCECMRSRF